MSAGKRWTVFDRYGNEVYLTHERWHHITESVNHPEMLSCETELRDTIRSGKRKQDALNPHKYRYAKAFDTLPEYNTHVVAIVLFRFRSGDYGEILPNNYMTPLKKA
jgi:hypothetical protein